MPTLTRSQLAALTELHRVGSLYGQGRAVGLPGIRQGTLNALVHAGVATSPGGRRFFPALTPWSDGYGNWHVRVPRRLIPPITERTTQGQAIARAVIAGEVLARGVPVEGYSYRPRVEVSVHRDVPADVVEYVEA